ncbi:MAG TPA: NAD-dependent epimerase/dehydratase family protein [Acidimicrobiia bacterium]|nr:NAD-dependent epimerase/dehydratase family protein [Acidimicrobiia bacterium]
MRVFVAGGTGVVGKRAVARLVWAGHDVTVLARSSTKDAVVRGLGAQPVRVDLFDADALRDAVAGHDAVVNLTTHIPPLTQMARMSAWSENERIRTEGSTNLVDAALAAGAKVFVQESLAFVYGEHGAEIISADTTGWGDSPFVGAVQAAEANVARFTASGSRGVVLRFGMFYADDSDQTVAKVKAARNGFSAEVGAADSYFPLIDADDAAAAAVAALDAPAGLYDVVDDASTRAEQTAALAAAVGRRRLHRPPKWATPKVGSYLAASQRVSNEKFRNATAWRPSSPTVREGYAKLVSELHMEPALPTRIRLALWVLVFTAFGVGAQAAFFPRSFYDDFPIGRGWVAMDGLYNEHLIRDVGVLNLALMVVTIGALVINTRAVARLTALAWLVYSVPHFVYHARHLTMDMAGGEKIALLGSLAIPVLLAIFILVDRNRSSVGSPGESVSGRAPAAVRDDDLRRDVGARA